MSGKVCFKGTRVPAQTLVDSLAHGDSLDDFLEGFPSVSRAQAIGFLEESGALLLKDDAYPFTEAAQTAMPELSPESEFAPVSVPPLEAAAQDEWLPPEPVAAPVAALQQQLHSLRLQTLRLRDAGAGYC